MTARDLLIAEQQARIAELETFAARVAWHSCQSDLADEEQR